MKQYRLLVSTVLAALALGTVAAPLVAHAAPVAQAKGGQRRAGGAAPIATLPVEVIDQLATLTADQKTKIQAIQDKAKTEGDAAPDRAGKAQVATKATDDIKAVLTADQLSTVQKAAPTLVMLNASKTIPFGALADVKLTKEQMTKISDIVTAEQAKLKGLKGQELKDKRTEAYADLKTQVEALLTADQKSAISKYDAAHPAGKKKKAA